MIANITDIQAEGEKLQKKKQLWIEQRIKMGGDQPVIQFISDILFHGAVGVSAEDAIETTRNLFEAGYCYYMAEMLEDAFPGGQECLCYPYGHIVYVYEGVAYDINGVSDAEHEMYIPITELGNSVNNFRHIPIPELNHDITEDEIYEIGIRCKKNGNFVHAISAHDQEIANRSRAICEEVPEARYIAYKTNYFIEKNRLISNLDDGYITKEQYERYLEESCWNIGLSYPLVKRFEQEMRFEKENSTQPEQNEYRTEYQEEEER